MAHKHAIQHVSSPLSGGQVCAYLERIEYPAYGKGSPFPDPTMETLKTIMLQHLLNVPFENLALHYEPDHNIHLTPEWLFNRIVVQRKGSYCMGVNTMLLWLLRFLGFRAYSGAARVIRPDGSTTGLSHMVLIVSVHDTQSPEQFYHVDVGFGPGNPLQPLPLKNEAHVPGGNPHLESHRLLNAPHPQSSQTLAKEHDWHLQHRSSPTAEWKGLYVFVTLELYPEDYAILAHAVNTLPGRRSIFQNNIFVNQFFKAPEVGEGAIGRWTIFGHELKRIIEGTEEVVRPLDFEEDRVEAIWEAFGIVIDAEQIVHMSGRQAELPRRVPSHQ